MVRCPGLNGYAEIRIMEYIYAQEICQFICLKEWHIYTVQVVEAEMNTYAGDTPLLSTNSHTIAAPHVHIAKEKKMLNMPRQKRSLGETGMGRKQNSRRQIEE